MVTRNGILIGGHVDGKPVPDAYLDRDYFQVFGPPMPAPDRFDDHGAHPRPDTFSFKFYVRLLTTYKHVRYVHFYDPDMTPEEAQKRAFKWHGIDT